jgi:hypothetical protein
MITDIVPKNIPLDNVFIPAIASGLASLGRFEDTYMVHAAKGETVIPKEVLDANPGLKEELFQQMIDMGIENPKRYVVGESLNSINPITGQPEFFFSSIKKFFQKAAPAIGGFLGGYFGPVGAAIGSGLGSKLAGQSTEQALTNAAIAGVGSYLLGGYGAEGQGTATTVPKGAPFSSLYPAAKGSMWGGSIEALKNAGGGLLSDFTAQQLASVLGGGLGGLAGGFLTEGGGDAKGEGAARAAAQAQRREVVGASIRDREIAAGRPTSPQFPGQQLANLTPEQLALLRERGLNRRPTFRNIPARAVAAVPSEQEQEIIDRMLAGQAVTQRQFPLDVRLRPVTPTVLNARHGGMVPGSRAQNKDTVPAALTPGEFVFTQDAVRGAAPNGTRQQQAHAMYNIMRGLEGRA